MNVFQSIAAAVVKKDYYPKFLKNRKRKVFAYGLFLVLLYFLLTMVIPYVRFQVETGGFKQIIKEEIPDFELRDGKLWMEKSFLWDYDGDYMEINTQQGTYDQDEINELYYYYSRVLVMDQDSIYMKSNGDVMQYSFSDNPEVAFTRENLIGLVPLFEAILIGVFIITYLIQVMLFFFGVLVISLIGLAVNAACGSKLTFGQIYLLTVYARTTSLLLKGILSLLHITVPFFFLLNFGATIIYLVLACQSVRDQEQATQQPQQMNW